MFSVWGDNCTLTTTLLFCVQHCRTWLWTRWRRCVSTWVPLTTSVRKLSTNTFPKFGTSCSKKWWVESTQPYRKSIHRPRFPRLSIKVHVHVTVYNGGSALRCDVQASSQVGLRFLRRGVPSNSKCTLCEFVGQKYLSKHWAGLVCSIGRSYTLWSPISYVFNL